MNEPIRTRCLVVGGGPAGIMLAYLLARGGIDVVVIEKHADFLRDFRGDTIHPSTLGLMNELGLLDRFLTLPHGTIKTLTGTIGGETLTVADFTGLPAPMNQLVIMPQWDFLRFLADEGRKNPHFTLKMKWAATALMEQAGRIVGVHVDTPDGPAAIEADLVVACDGRHSTIRAAAGLKPHDIGAPMDVMWFSLPRGEDDTLMAGGYFDQGAILVAIDRGDLWQCGYVIPKGGDAKVRAAGLDAFRERIAAIEPKLRGRLAALASMDDVKLLTVGVDRLERWHKPGLLLIGDAAHTMSPVGGVGINLAVQDAVASANLLVGKLRAGVPTDDDLAAVQGRREFPAKATQAAQVFIQNRIVTHMLTATERPHPPLILRALAATRWFARIPARAIGMGVRPEHISPDILSGSTGG
jgi:2-polyprenyl-6-methoxyphenol hydroxylase-like FAD-dependent oxidoreductase